jgi:tetratricopeptide (TPR) repeat protein
MPWQFRKRIRLGPGVHINVGKRSASLSIGGAFARTSISTQGHATQTFSIPGSGLYRRERIRMPATAEVTSRQIQSVSPAEAGYAGAMDAYLHGDFATAFGGFTKAIEHGVGVDSARLLAATAAIQLGRFKPATSLLERVVQSEFEVPDDLMARYAPPDYVKLTIEMAIVEGVYAPIVLDSVGATLLLAELYQAARKRESAIDLVRQLHDLDPTDEMVALSLCDLLYEDADFPGVIAAGDAIAPTTDLGLSCHIFRAQAQGDMGDMESARATLESALMSTESQDSHILDIGRAVLGVTYEQLGRPRSAEWLRRVGTGKPQPNRRRSKSAATVYVNPAPSDLDEPE